MLDNCPGSIRQDIPACLRSGRFRDGAGVPRPLPLRWAYADQTAGGQIHLPTVSNTINSEPTNIDRLDIEAPRELPGFGAPDGALLGHDSLLMRIPLICCRSQRRRRLLSGCPNNPPKTASFLGAGADRKHGCMLTGLYCVPRARVAFR